jgi:biopolymer transport protein ExbB
MKRIRFNMAFIVLPLSVVLAYYLYHLVLGDPANFVDGDTSKEPLNGNFLGTIYKGGQIVILLLSFQFIMLTYVVERFLALNYSAGKGDLLLFVQKVKALLLQKDYSKIVTTCDEQKGAVGNVVKTGLAAYINRETGEADQKDIYLIQKELEEATQLELPLLNKNMFILSTIAQIATLVGLLGTVTGMIKAFAALASVGEPDAVGLASGISQALVTTALGISTAAVTIVFYNYFSNKIDQITYAIDEVGFSIVHSLKIKYLFKNEQ